MAQEEPAILGIETSSPFTYLAVLKGTEVLAKAEHLEKFAHSEALNPMLESVLAGARLTIQDLDLVAVSIGPGYFTALRAGLSFGKAIAFALGKPLVGVNSLDALAFSQRDGDASRVVPAVDAQKRMVYAAIFDREGKRLDRRGDYLLVFPEKLKDKAGEALFLGSGAELYPDVLSPRPVSNPLAPDPANVARLGIELHRDRGPSDLDSLEPFYLRITDAEAKLEGA